MLQDFDWAQAIRTSPVMIVILACSVLTFGFALERSLYFWRRRDNIDGIARAALDRIRDGDLKGAARECARSKHPFGPVASELLQNAHQSNAESDEGLQIVLTEQRLLFERNLGFLGTMGNTAPLIGLLGTVWGIMRAFHDMARTGSAGPSVVAAGVAEALFTTAASLLVAVPAVLLFNHFTRRAGVMLAVAETRARQLRRAVVSGADGRSRPATQARPHGEHRDAKGDVAAQSGVEVALRS